MLVRMCSGTGRRNRFRCVASRRRDTSTTFLTSSSLCQCFVFLRPAVRLSSKAHRHRGSGGRQQRCRRACSGQGGGLRRGRRHGRRRRGHLRRGGRRQRGVGGGGRLGGDGRAGCLARGDAVAVEPDRACSRWQWLSPSAGASHTQDSREPAFAAGCGSQLFFICD